VAVVIGSFGGYICGVVYVGVVLLGGIGGYLLLVWGVWLRGVVLGCVLCVVCCVGFICGLGCLFD